MAEEATPTTGEEQPTIQEKETSPVDTLLEGQETETEGLEETVQTEESTEEPSHAEKSWIGRRDKALREEFKEELRQNQEQLLSSISQIMRPAQQASPEQQQFQEDFDLTDPNQFQRAAAGVYTQIEQHKLNYQNDVATRINTRIQADPMLRTNPDLAKEVSDAAYRIRLSPNLDSQAQADFLVNQAKATVYENKITAPTTAFKGKAPTTTATGTVTASAPAQKKSPKLPPLSSYAKDFQRRFNMSDEEIAEVLSKE